MPDDAIRFLLCEAAEVARQRYADVESATLMRRAIALCRAFPETNRRLGQELELLIRLGPVLASTRGYASGEVEENYARAVELSRLLGDRRHLFATLSGSWVFHIVRGQVETSRCLAAELLQFGIDEQSGAITMAGHFLVASSLFHLGKFADAMEQVDRCLAAHDAGSRAVLAFFAGSDVRAFCRSYRAQLLWQLGESEATPGAIAEAIGAAQDVAHPFSIAIALDYAALLHVLRNEPSQALARAEEAAALCRKHEFAYYLAMAELVAGWAIAMESDPDRRRGKQLRRGMEGLKGTGAELRLPYYHGMLAEACARAGLHGEALANISNGFAYQSKNGETWAASDLHRIHGDVLVASGNREQAELSYRRAIEAARQSGAVSFERRANERIERLTERRASAS